MLFKWFNAKEAVHLGVKLAEDFTLEFAKSNRKHSKDKDASRAIAVQNFFRKLDKFDGKVALNFYKKSRLINEFRWRLTEKGYDKDLVDILARELLARFN